MVRNWDVRRGDIWQANLGKNTGSEQSGERPVIIISNNVGNKFSPTFLGIPLTSKPKKNLPTHGVVPANHNGLDTDSTYLAEQITTIDKSRMLYRRGQLTREQMAEMDAALCISIGIAAMQEGHFAPKSVY